VRGHSFGHSVCIEFVRVSNWLILLFNKLCIHSLKLSSLASTVIALEQSAAFDCIGYPSWDVDPPTDARILTHKCSAGFSSIVSQFPSIFRQMEILFFPSHQRWPSRVPQSSASGPHAILHVHCVTNGTHPVVLSTLPSTCGRYTALRIGYAMSRTDSDGQLETLERCFSKVHERLSHNGLALNPAYQSDARSSFPVVAGVHARMMLQQSTFPALKSIRQQPSKATGVILDQHHSVVQATSRRCLQIVLLPHTSSMSCSR